MDKPARSRSASFQDRRREILTAAGETFYEKGYHAASMQDIADKVGILKPGLYYYVSSKEELLHHHCW
jgi:TetR/AcrR family transcriptional regulator, cholesterol catabolism regulator